MVRARNAGKRVALSGDIRDVSEQTREEKFWRCVTFSDTVGRYCEITMKKDNISPLHGLAMFYLICAGGTSTPTQLADRMFRSKHSLTKIIDNLEKEGLIVRDFSHKDRRVTQIRVTAAGLEYARANQNKGNIRGKQVMDCLDASEQETLKALMDKMARRMTDILEKL